MRLATVGGSTYFLGMACAGVKEQRHYKGNQKEFFHGNYLAAIKVDGIILSCASAGLRLRSRNETLAAKTVSAK